MRREPAAGADMLERWARRGPASTLYVLHTVLRSVDREDCLLLLERSIYTRVVCVNLMACIKHEDSLEINHVSAQVCADASLAESLAGVLETPLEEKFRLLDPGVTWTGSIAKDFKGRQLTILKLSKLTPMVQDPTVDSSVDIDNTVSARINLPMNYNHPRHFYLNIPYEDMGTSPNSRKHSLETNVSPIVKVPTSTSVAKKSFTNYNNSDPTVCYANMSSQRESEDTLHGKKRHPQVIFTNTVDSKQSSTSPMSECIQRPGSYAKDSKSGAKQTITMERNMQKNFDEICKKSDHEKYVDMRKSCSDCNGNCVHVSNENSYVKQIFRNPVACENQTDLNVRNISNLSRQNSANTNNSYGSDCCNSDEDKTMNSEEIINGIGEDDVFRREIVSEKQNVQDGEFVDTDMLCDSFDKCSAIGDDKGAVLNETVSEMMQSFGDGINVESPVNVTAETAGNLGENPVYQSDSFITYVKEYMFSQKENGTGLVNLNDCDKPTRCENKRKFYSCLSYTKVVHESYHEGNVSRFDKEELSDDSTTHLKTLFTSATHANEDITDQVEEHGEGMVNNCDISDKDDIPNYLDFNKFLQNSEESPTMGDLETRMDHHECSADRFSPINYALFDCYRNRFTNERNESFENDENRYEDLKQTDESNYVGYRSGRQRDMTTLAEIFSPTPSVVEQDKSSIADEKVRRKRFPGRYNTRKTENTTKSALCQMCSNDSIINSVLTAVATNVETSSANIMEQKKPVCAQKPSKLKRSKPVPRIRYSKVKTH
ncbi:uncharacterized protein LOC127868293 [Dreissena polymorpha]|nr:uncharacterized protein LOC127868293 [Dreissena polymorpha]